jgi:hypothetical protein
MTLRQDIFLLEKSILNRISWNLTVPMPNIYMNRISVRFGWADLDGREVESHPELQGDVEPDRHDDMQKVLFFLSPSNVL